MSLLYLLSAVLGVGWVILLRSENQNLVDAVQEINTLDEAFSSFRSIDTRPLLMALVFVISLSGLSSSVSLIVGTIFRYPCCLLPWLVWHMIVILLAIGSGFYLVIHFTLLVHQKDLVSAVVSLGPILLGVFLIFIWILVDQFYIKLRRLKQPRVTETLVRSLQSNFKLTEIQVNEEKNHITISDRGQTNKKKLASFKEKHSRRPYHKALGYSKSLENILDSSSYSSNSTYQSEIISCKLPGITTLPRLRRCTENPAMFRACMVTDDYASKSGTLRSIGSCKSVSIHPTVTEYHYNNEDHLKEEEDNKQDMLSNANEVDESLEKIEGSVPIPVYPTISSNSSWKLKTKEKRKSLTKEQIIELYCSKE